MTRIRQALRLARSSDRRKVKRGRRILIEQGVPLGYARIDWAIEEFGIAMRRVTEQFQEASRRLGVTLDQIASVER